MLDASTSWKSIATAESAIIDVYAFTGIAFLTAAEIRILESVVLKVPAFLAKVKLVAETLLQIPVTVGNALIPATQMRIAWTESANPFALQSAAMTMSAVTTYAEVLAGNVNQTDNA